MFSSSPIIRESLRERLSYLHQLVQGKQRVTFLNYLQGVQIFCHNSQVLDFCHLSTIKAAHRFALDFFAIWAQEVMSLSQKTHRDKTAGELHGTVLIPPTTMIHMLQTNTGQGTRVEVKVVWLNTVMDIWES